MAPLSLGWEDIGEHGLRKVEVLSNADKGDLGKEAEEAARLNL